jgi:hypothetical protein
VSIAWDRNPGPLDAVLRRNIMRTPDVHPHYVDLYLLDPTAQRAYFLPLLEKGNAT